MRPADQQSILANRAVAVVNSATHAAGKFLQKNQNKTIRWCPGTRWHPISMVEVSTVGGENDLSSYDTEFRLGVTREMWTRKQNWQSIAH
jgi:hypothetical protein